MTHKGWKILGAALGGICLCFLCLWGVLSSQSVMTAAAEQGGTLAAEALNTRVEIGNIQVKSWRELQLDGVDVYDKQEQLVAHVEEATVRVAPWAILNKPLTESISEVNINQADVSILQRQDGTWNYEDLLSGSESTSKFTAQINIADSVLRSRYNNQDIILEKVNGTVDMADYPAITLKAACEHQGTKAELSATLDTSDMAAEGKTGGRQTFQLALQDAELAEYLPYLPAGTVPEAVVRDISGHVASLKLSGQRVGQELFYSGQAELANGSCVLLESHKVENIKALVTFDERDARIFASAETQGQKASARGKISFSTGSPVLDLTAESESFDPAVVLPDIPYEGAVKFTAHITGAADNPRVDAEVNIPQGSIKGAAFSDLSARAVYADSMVLVHDLKAAAAGGSVRASGSFDAKSYDLAASVSLQDISAWQAGSIVSSLGAAPGDLSTLGGSLSGEIAVSGNANAPDSLQFYGTVNGSGLSYRGVAVNELKSSFAKEGDKISFDYISCLLPNGGSLGLEGTLQLGKNMDMAFYGSEVDLSLVEKLLPEVPVAGYLDIKGTIQGDIDNPIVRAKYAARDGSIFHQPFDRLHGSAGGSLRGVKINDFVMEHGPETKWYADGVVGFLGDRGINLRIDTVAARMEDIMQAIAPEQQLTGNVDNVITITGTLKNPQVVGYVHFYQGSYNGIFINGMDGDYLVQDKTLTLQDFHVFTPWVDVDFNGTIDGDSNISLAAKVHEIDLSRYNKFLPIPLQGKAQFSGNLAGTISRPLFEGRLTAQGLTVNGQEIRDVGGTVRYSDNFIFFNDMNFAQLDGTYKFDGRVNIQNKGIHGRLDVDKGDIHSLVSMAGMKENGINGTITGNAIFGGTLEQPEAKVAAFVTDGSLGSYALSNVAVDAALDKRKIYINDFSGREGTSGSFKLNGTVDLDGAVDVNASLRSVDVGALTEAAGVKTKVAGMLDTEVHIGGTCQAPQAEIPVSVRNLQVQNTLLDSLDGTLKLENQVIAVQKLTASKSYNNRTYSLTANGQVPLAALTEEIPTESNQFDVDFALDNADLSLLPTLSSYIDWAVGPTDGHMRLQGTAQRPYVTGILTVADGAMKLRNVVKPVTGLNIRLLCTGNTMTLEQCTGTMGSGSFNVAGFLHLDGSAPDEYNFAVNFNGLDVDSPVFKGALNANINVKNEAAAFPGQSAKNIPKISGRLFLENVLLSLPSELPQSSDSMPLAALDYTVELGKNVRFLSAALGDLRLAGGAYFGGTTQHPNTSGSIYVLRGSLSYLKTNFKVYEGSMKFGQMDSLLPKIDLQAGTKINKTSVFLSLTGPVDSMQFRLMSNPRMSEADIIQLLTLRSDYYNQDKSDGSKFASALNIGLQMTILSEVEEAMRNVLNLDVFSIERDTVAGSKNRGDGAEKNGDKNDYEVYNITLGKSISDKLLVKYNKSMTTSDYSYGVDYELSDKITLSYKRDQDNDYYAGVEARITF